MSSPSWNPCYWTTLGCFLKVFEGTDTHRQHNDHLHTNQVELAGEDEAKEDSDGELRVESKTISTL